MRDLQIEITPFEYIAILDIKINSEVNEHTKAVMEIRIKEAKTRDYLEQLTEETWVDILSVDESGEKGILFQGVVVNYSIQTRHHETILYLEMASGTFLMDIQEHFRTFQDKEMPYETVHEIIGNEYKDCIFLNPGNKGKSIDHFVIQYQETDWAFLKRLAAEAGEVLTVEGRRKGIRYFIGIPQGETRKMEEGEKVRIVSNYAEFLRKKQNGMPNISQSDCMEVIFDGRELYEIGDILTYGRRSYVIYRIESNYKNAEFLHTYYLKPEIGLPVPVQGPSRSAGCSLDAVVTAVKGDKVKVDVSEDENTDRPERQWLVFSTIYSSPDGTGWYCMPEIGDHVQVCVPEKEGDVFVINSVHVETDSGRSNPDHKSFKNRYGKEILLTPDRMLMTNNQGLKIELSDGKGIFIESNKDIAIRADGNLQVSSQAASLTIAAGERVDVTQGHTTMTVKEDITFAGGQFRMQ